MKTTSRVLALFATMAILLPNLTQTKELQRPQHKWIEHESISGSDIHLYHNINKSNFTSSGVGGTPVATYTIPKSGYYLFTENCVATTISSPSNAAMLYVGQDNTVIDLGSCAIGESTGSSTLDVIVIDANNVTIKNGTICAANKGAAIRVASGKKSITLQNLTIKDCLTEGIHINGATGAGNDVHNVQIRNCVVQDVTAAAENFGILAEYTDDLLIENTVVTNISTTSGTCNGIELNNCSRAKLNNVEITNLTASNGMIYALHLDTSTASEFINCKIMGCSASNVIDVCYLTGSSCNIFKNCDLISNTSSGSQAYGVYATGSDYNTFDGVKIINLTGTSIVTGFVVYNIDGTYIQNCIVRGCVDADGDFYGIDIWGSTTDCNIEGCSISDNTSSATTSGINIRSSAVDCVITKNEFFNNIGTTAGYGVNDGNATSYNLLQRNVAYRNMADGGAVTNYNVASGGDTDNFQLKSASITNFTAYSLSDPIYNFEILTG